MKKSGLSWLHPVDAAYPRAKHAQDKPLTEKAGTRNENLRQALYDLRVEQVRISAVTEDLKAARQAVMDSAAQRTHELTTLQSQNASAKSRLVQSPERIKKHISEMSFTVSQERASLQSHQRKARELAHRMEVIGGMEVDLRGLIDLEKGIEVQRTRVEEARRGVMSLRGKVESQQIEGKSMEAKLGVSCEMVDRHILMPATRTATTACSGEAVEAEGGL